MDESITDRIAAEALRRLENPQQQSTQSTTIVGASHDGATYRVPSARTDNGVRTVGDIGGLTFIEPAAAPVTSEAPVPDMPMDAHFEQGGERTGGIIDDAARLLADLGLD